MEPDAILIEVKNKIEKIDNQKDALIAQNRLLRQEQNNIDREIIMNIEAIKLLGDRRSEIISEFMDLYNKSSL